MLPVHMHEVVCTFIGFIQPRYSYAMIIQNDVKNGELGDICPKNESIDDKRA